MPEIVRTKLISRYYDDPLVGHFEIDKTRTLIAQKYHWSIFCHNVEVYITGYDICSASKAIRHKLYDNLQSLIVPTH